MKDRIIIQEPTDAKDEIGGVPLSGFADYLTGPGGEGIDAAFVDLSADDIIRAAAYAEQLTHTIRVRYDVRLKPWQRVKYHDDRDGEDHYFDVKTVIDEGARHLYMRLVCVEYVKRAP